ncbi:MAG: hypothetical protein WD646_03285 [Actinomycetota bacterium]
MQPDQGIGAVAAEQYGVFTRAQALDAGFTDKVIANRISKSIWGAVRPGLYAIAGAPETFHRRVLGGVLVSGVGASASHRTAGFLQGLIPDEPALVDVTVPHGTHYRSRSGLVVHQAVVLEARDVCLVAGIRTTTTTRTVVDLAGMLGPLDLETVNDDALIGRLTSIPTLRACIERVGANRRGMGTLNRLLDDREFGVPESELERVFLRLVKSYRLPRPERSCVDRAATRASTSPINGSGSSSSSMVDGGTARAARSGPIPAGRMPSSSTGCCPCASRGTTSRANPGMWPTRCAERSRSAHPSPLQPPQGGDGLRCAFGRSDAYWIRSTILNIGR